jgi:hypothetical protein
MPGDRTVAFTRSGRPLAPEGAGVSKPAANSRRRDHHRPLTHGARAPPQVLPRPLLPARQEIPVMGFSRLVFRRSREETPCADLH